MLASTISSGSLTWSLSLGPKSGERGRAMSPVRPDSRTPKGEMSFMKESIRDGFAELRVVSVPHETHKTVQKHNSHFDDTAIGTDIQNLSTELMSEVSDGLQMLMLQSQRLTQGQPAGVKIIQLRTSSWHLALDKLLFTTRNLSVMSHELFEILRAQDIDLRQQQFPLHQWRGGIVQHRPYRHQILQLAAGLLDYAILTRQHDCHAREVLNLGRANDQRVDVEASSGEDA